MTNVFFLRWGWLLLSVCLYGLLGYNVPRAHFPTLVCLYALLCWGYLLRIRPLLTPASAGDEQPAPDAFLFRSAVLFRLLLLGAMPALSDDYARFIWDGRLLLAGINPFRYLPSELVTGTAGGAFSVDTSLFGRLNSPDYYTVYPPVSQALFALAAGASPQHLPGSVLLLRLPVLLADIGTMALMRRLLVRFRQNPNLALLYALNPLVILELTGNVHLEGVMFFFVLLAVWWWVRPPLAGQPVPCQRLAVSAGAFAMGVGTKLLPLLLLPLVVARLGWRRGLTYSAVVGVFVCLLFAPFFDLDMLRHMLTSLDLYIRKFEFNASLYYLIREAGYYLRGYNVLSQIGGWLSLLTTLGLLGIAFARTKQGASAPMAARVLWMLTLYFAMATTVHPWYISSLVAATVFTGIGRGRPFRYPLLWSGLIYLSYAAYQHTPVRESPVLLVLEYVPVLLLMGAELMQTRTDKF